MNIRIQLLNASVAKIFGTETLFDSTYTGITDFRMNIYHKTSPHIEQVLAQKNSYGKYFQRMTLEYQPINSPGQAQNVQIQLGHNSSNNIILGFERDDQSDADSTYYKQRFTLFPAATQLAFINGAYPLKEQFWTFGDINLDRGNQTYSVFTQDISDIFLIRRECLRSFNMLQQYDGGISSAATEWMQLMFCYNIININLQAFSVDEIRGVDDVLFDGYSSVIEKLRARFQIRLYENGYEHTDIPATTSTAATVGGAQYVIDGTAYHVATIQTFDYLVNYKPSGQLMSLTENPESVVAAAPEGTSASV